MKKKIDLVNGMPVEIPILDEQGEQERARLNKLALQEYKETGTLSSKRLQEANAEFLERVGEHLLRGEEPS